jgi:hypothetical protein
MTECTLKKLDFRKTLNNFFFVKFLSRIFDVEHFEHFFRDHNNLVIPKKKKIKKKSFSSSFVKFKCYIKSNNEKVSKKHRK